MPLRKNTFPILSYTFLSLGFVVWTCRAMTVRREKLGNTEASSQRSLQSLGTGFTESQEDVGIRGKSTFWVQ